MHFTKSFVAAAAAAGVRAQEFTWTGTNQAGGEFGETVFPGQLGKHYIWPTPESVDTLAATGMNTFRVGTRMERLVPDDISGPINETYFEGLKNIVDHITGQGHYAVIDPHNYGRYYGNIINDIDGFSAWWTKIASRFACNALVIFDTNNEYHTMENSLVHDLNQAAIDAIRAAGATSQWIWVEGNAWSGAWSWVSSGNGESMLDLSDPEDKLVYEMHQYLDSDSSGTHTECVSPTIGVERLQEATEWLRQNGKIGILGETAGASNDVCKQAVVNELDFLLDNSDVWKGWLWWAAGPWWGDYMFSLEPPTGVAYQNMLSEIQPFIGA
ncbi:Endo-beta-glucanase A-like protein [Emericellopsis cladophorae]|uniref:cellulase n=1 Tax=Emericellopsis cladophorae TaxID=2686198 RepID=A0A9Q0BDH9_9HYPO|nr:Endo-beta-glucanase A-like protein [Emericellopsis cladophorae]KAI6780846.1 Endo-beta-glucanase A-like protein [Emericellopsis cladophorae]